MIAQDFQSNFQTSYRSHSCGSLTIALKNKNVKLCGWIHSKRDHGGIIFFDLRDNYGIVQLVFNENDERINKNEINFNINDVDKLKLESVIQIEGILTERNDNDKNKNQKNGDFEIVIQKLNVLSSSFNVPFQINQNEKCNEELRLKYRFLDLRRENLHNNIILRSEVLTYIRNVMTKKGFYEINTPILTSSSPEGARDYLVPSRVHKGKFYALPQAPQQFKQLLMVGGFDKYFQIAPCFRDEDSRADRSPGEFYQLDIEMSFVDQKDVFDTIEPVLKDLFLKFGNKKISEKPFEIIKYKDSMLKYGNDKPDLRNPIINYDATEFFAKSGFSIFANSILNNSAVVRAIPIKNCSEQPRSFFDAMINFALENGAKGLAYIIIEKDGSFKSPIAKFLKTEELEGIKKAGNLENGDAVFFACDKEGKANKIAGLVRTELGKKLNLINKDEFKFCWIVDFPYFEFDEENQKIDFMHNPFSKMQCDFKVFENLLKENNQEELLKIEAYQYDIVCNGIELSSGAIRNTDLNVMYKAFNLVGYSKEEVDEKFGNLIDAFNYGVPPHGGLAPGIERMLMLLTDSENIRNTIAFPMTGKAEDLMMKAPSSVSEKTVKRAWFKNCIIKNIKNL